MDKVKGDFTIGDSQLVPAADMKGSVDLRTFGGNLITADVARSYRAAHNGELSFGISNMRFSADDFVKTVGSAEERAMFAKFANSGASIAAGNRPRQAVMAVWGITKTGTVAASKRDIM